MQTVVLDSNSSFNDLGAQENAMPLVIVTTNVSKSSAETEAALHDLSSATAAALNVPEKLAMVQLTLDTPMIFQGSTEPCAIIDFRTVGALEAKINKKVRESV